MNFKCLFKSIFLISLFFLFSCGTTGNLVSDTAEETSGESSEENENPSISLVFAGDIMAHETNYKNGNFNLIWQDVKPLVSSGDLSFANIEAPVNDDMEWSAYPQFNMHSEYVNAAIKAGFNVFSLANNHSNDWSLEGINATKTYFASRNDVWACGLKRNLADKITYRLIQKGEWKVLFVAYTELLNSDDSSKWIDYFPQKKRDFLIDQLKKLYAINRPDIFVVSVHTDEEEYKSAVTENHRTFYKRLISECGVDVVWANHPHVYKKFEEVKATFKNGDANIPKNAFIMYANGNTISGQRSSPSLAKAQTSRDDTGDGLIIKLTFEKEQQGTSSSAVKLKTVEPPLITSYIMPNGQTVVRLADKDFIRSLTRAGLFSWANYVQLRKDIYEKAQGSNLWQ